VGSLPDTRFAGEVLAVGDDSYTRLYSNTGTQTGTLAGKAPSGKHFEAWGLYLARLQDRKMVESWTAYDDLGMRVQLGLVAETR
jgi:predicted ester cyclase